MLPPGSHDGNAAALPQTARPFHRPVLVAILAVLLIIGGALMVVAGIVLAVGLGLVGGLLAGGGGVLVGAALGAAVVVGGALMLVSGLGLWGMRPWAWWLAVLVLVLQLLFSLGSPGLWGKVALVLLLVYMVAVRRHIKQ